MVIIECSEEEVGAQIPTEYRCLAEAAMIRVTNNGMRVFVL